MRNLKMKKIENPEATQIINIYRFFNKDGSLYLLEDKEIIDTLFYAVIEAINNSGPLKPQLPYKEFVYPCKELSLGNKGWIEHFEDRDNRKFFLSDIYDYLQLFYQK